MRKRSALLWAHADAEGASGALCRLQLRKQAGQNSERSVRCVTAQQSIVLLGARGEAGGEQLSDGSKKHCRLEMCLGSCLWEGGLEGEELVVFQLTSLCP